jgi:hypothetical protein
MPADTIEQGCMRRDFRVWRKGMIDNRHKSKDTVLGFLTLYLAQPHVETEQVMGLIEEAFVRGLIDGDSITHAFIC